jgi:hypothetical protein
MGRMTWGAPAVVLAATAFVPAGLAASGRGWEVALTHVHTRVAAGRVLAEVKGQAAAQHLRALIELDGKGDFEVSIVGFPSQKAAAAGAAESRAAFKHAAVERA